MAQISLLANPPDFTTSNAMNGSDVTWDGAYVVSTINASSGVTVQVFKVLADELDLIYSQTADEAYGSIGVKWDPTGSAFFVQMNRTSGQIPRRNVAFFELDRATDTVTMRDDSHLPATFTTGLAYDAAWMGQYAITTMGGGPYWYIYRRDDATSPLTRLDVTGTTTAGICAAVAVHPSGEFLLRMNTSGAVVRLDKVGEVFTASEMTLPGHLMATNTFFGMVWDPTGTYLLFNGQPTGQGSYAELYEYDASTTAFTRITIPTILSVIGRPIAWCPRRKGFVQINGSTSGTRVVNILRRDEATGTWAWEVYEENLPLFFNGRSLSFSQLGDVMVVTTTATPSLTVFRIKSVITSSGAFTVGKPSASFAVKVPMGIKGTLQGTPPTSEGLISIPNGATLSALARLPRTDITVASAVGEEPVTELLLSYPAIVMLETSGFGFKDQEPTSNVVFGAIKAPSPFAEGYFKQPVGVFTSLTSPRPYLDGTMMVIEPDRRPILGELTSPSPNLEGALAVGLSVMPSYIVAPKAAMDGELYTPLAWRGDLVSPRPAIDAFISNFYLQGEFSAPSPTMRGTIENAVLLIEDGLGSAPRATIEGELHLISGFNGPLKAPMAATQGEVWQDIHVSATLTAPQAMTVGLLTFSLELEGELRAPAPSAAGELLLDFREVTLDAVGPLASLQSEIKVPTGITSDLQAPKPQISAIVKAPMGVVANLRAPKAKASILALRYLRVDVLARAPSAYVSGQLAFLPRFQGALSGPRPKASGELNQSYRTSGELRAPSASIAGQLTVRHLLSGNLHAPKPHGAGEFDLHLKTVGDLLAPKPLTDGQLGIRAYLEGSLTAPSSSANGLLTQFLATVGALVSPAPKAEGLLVKANAVEEGVGASPLPAISGILSTRYLVQQDGSAPAAQFLGHLHLQSQMTGDLTAPGPRIDGLLHLRSLVNSVLTAPSAKVDGLLKLRYLLDGALTAPGAQVAGELQAIMKRRQLRIIIPYN